MKKSIYENSISVVIPMYNSEDSIIRSLKSIYNQTKLEYILEIIIVNDGSTDNSEEIVNEFIKKTNNDTIDLIIINQVNSGVSTARNVGMEKSNGTWIAFLDSDDAWYHDKIEKQIEIIENNNVDFLSGNMNSNPTRILFKKYTTLFSPTINEICLKSLSQPSTVIMRKKIYFDIGGFDVNQSYAEDGNYFLKVKTKFNYYHNPFQCIEYGYDKRGFGQGGLSGNLLEMHKGNLKNLEEMYLGNYITTWFFYTCKVFYKLKYVRRILLSRFF